MVEQAPEQKLIDRILSGKEEEVRAALGFEFISLARQTVDSHGSLKQYRQHPGMNAAIEVRTTEPVYMEVDHSEVGISVENEVINGPESRRQVGSYSLRLSIGETSETFKVEFLYGKPDNRTLPDIASLESGLAVLRFIQNPHINFQPNS